MPTKEESKKMLRSTFTKVVALVLMFWMGVIIYLMNQQGGATKFPSHMVPRPHHKIEHPKPFIGNQEVKGHGSDQIVHVCFTSDQNTVLGLIAAMQSIHSNTRHSVYYHLVLEDDVIAGHVRHWIDNSKLRDAKYEIKVFDGQLVKGKIRVRGGRIDLAKPMNYARFYYPYIFPQLTRIVHIDDDCIVQGDISELFHMHLYPGHIAAFLSDCHSLSNSFVHLQNKYADYLNFNHPEIKRLDMNQDACSFNTGVYVADLSMWKKRDITRKLEWWMTLNTREKVYGNERGGGGSQPPLMITLYGLYSPLDPLWHVQHLGTRSGAHYPKDILRKAKLLHWNGHLKPWRREAYHTDIWNQYYIPDPWRIYIPAQTRKKKRS